MPERRGRGINGVCRCPHPNVRVQGLCRRKIFEILRANLYMLMLVGVVRGAKRYTLFQYFFIDGDVIAPHLWSHSRKTNGRLPLLPANPMVTFPSTEHHRPIIYYYANRPQLKVTLKRYSSHRCMSELRNVTCRMAEHSVTFHPTQVNPSRLNPSQMGRYST